MDYIADVIKDLKSYFSNNSLFKSLLPLDIFLVLIGLFVMLIMDFSSLDLGSFLNSLISTVAYWAFLLGIVLAFANDHMVIVYVGLFIYAADDLVYVFKGFGPGVSFNIGYLIDAAVYAFLGYCALRRSMKPKTQPGM